MRELTKSLREVFVNYGRLRMGKAMGHEGVPMDSEGRSMMPRPQGRGYPQVVRSRPFADGEAFNFSLVPDTTFLLYLVA